MNMNERIENVTLTKVCSIKPDKDSTESKTIRLEVKFNGATLGDVFAKSMSTTVVSWQNGIGRKHFDTFKDGQVVKIQFTAPASRTQVDPETAMIQMLRSMTPEEQAKKLKELASKINE